MNHTLLCGYEGKRYDKEAIVAWLGTQVDYAVTLPKDFVLQHMHYALMSLVHTSSIHAARGQEITEDCWMCWVSGLDADLSFIQVKHPINKGKSDA